MIYVARIDYVDSGGTSRTAWFTTGRSWRTSASDTPASTLLVGRLANPGSITRAMFADASSFGAVQTGYGYIELENADGALDDWRSYALAGNEFQLWMLDREGAPSTDWIAGPALRMYGCAINQGSGSRQMGRIVIALRDRIAELDVPLAPNRFAGTGGLEGAALVAGVRKPWGAGDCFNAEPVLIDNTTAIYVVQDGTFDAATIGRYNRAGGAALGREANYTTLSALLSTFPSPGYAKHYPPGGALRLGSAYAYPITSDISFGGTTDKLAHRVLEAMALRAGISSGDISSSDLSALDSSPTINAGYYVRDEETARSAMSKVANGAGLFFFFDLAGVLRFGKVDTASGSAVWAFHEDSTTNIVRDVAGGLTAPVWKVTLRWRKRWKAMSDVGGAASLAERADLSLGWDETSASSSTTLTRNPYAQQLVVDSYCLNLDSVAAPSTEATRRLNLFKEIRAAYRVTVSGLSAGLLGVDLGDTVSLEMRDDRMGLGTPGLFRVIGVQWDFGADRATYTLWG